jgi:hypothetical protein
MFTEAEITELKLMKNINHFSKTRSYVWVKAFDYYNKNNVRKLGMGCAPCYYKVLKYILDNQ